MSNVVYVICLSFVVAAQSFAITPGGAYEVFNASSGTVEIQCLTVDHPDARQPVVLKRGFGSWGSGDQSELIALRIRYRNGKVIVFDRADIARLTARTDIHRGAWWIEDSGVTYIPRRDANFRQRAFR